MPKKIWMCSCGMYWVFDKAAASRHAKEEGHELKEIELSDTELEHIKKQFPQAFKRDFGE